MNDEGKKVLSEKNKFSPLAGFLFSLLIRSLAVRPQRREK